MYEIRPNNMVLMYDEWTGRYFRGSKALVENAVLFANLHIARYGDCCLDTFYDQLGLDRIQSGQDYGWSGEVDFDVRFGTLLAPNDEPAIAFRFAIEPRPALGQYSRNPDQPA